MSSGHWEAVIGLEIHVQLATQTKMFCRCPNRYGDAPNTNVCPVCLAHPGMLPVANEQAVRQAIRVGLALGCAIPDRAKFDRKNYFYPDSPKAYQISQYDQPLCAAGAFHVPSDDGAFTVRITRAHLEEDAAKTIHLGGDAGRIAGSDASIVDFNRCGTPLLEVVTEPDLRSAEQARRFLTLLRATVVATGASDCDMEKGSLRCDANVSVRRVGDPQLGVKCELKNMNSFRFLERGISREIQRQQAILEAGASVQQATMHYDPERDALTLLRTKEEADDYRYFPEPDLVPLAPSRTLVDSLRASLPELPVPRIERLVARYALPEQTAETLALNPPLSVYFEELVRRTDDPRQAANWVMGEFAAHLNTTGLDADSSPVTPERLAPLVALVTANTVSSTAAKQIFAGLVDDPAADAATLVETLGLAQVTDDDAIGRLVDETITNHPTETAAYRAGKTQLIGFLTGQVMRASGGRADPKAVQRLLRDRLG
jgi:aspartyl-tRNA(Asn)/glutamyl-tRNA(Gln) amidotransferase subunit B